MGRQAFALHLRQDNARWDGIGESFCEVYGMYGLESAIFFLRTVLSRRMPLSQINVISLSEDMRVLTPVCSTNPDCSAHREITPEGRRPRYICPDAPVGEVLVQNNLPASIRDFKRFFSERGTCFVGQESLLRIPFYVRDGITYLMQFWSKAPHVFTPRRAMAIQRVLVFFQELLEREGFEFHEKHIINAAAPSPTKGYDHLCRCAAMSEVLKKIIRVAPTRLPVLVVGEAGVGKESVADALHELSERHRGPIVKVNCGAISENLVDSELFGHVKGSFTGAVSTHYGYFEEADKGTLFLDEIGELPLSAQVKLLRVLDNHTFQKVGSSKVQCTDVRLIAATNRDLAEMVRQGTFRKDLYYRLSVYPIQVPPLRERHEDILPLTEYFIRLFAAELDRRVTGGISEKDIPQFYQYGWPGNVRELRNVVARAMVDYVSGKELAELLRNAPLDNRVEETDGSFHPPKGWPTLAELEQSYIAAVVRHARGKMSGSGSASSILGIHYTTLRSHMRRLGL